jgi:hypothetical protein
MPLHRIHATIVKKTPSPYLNCIAVRLDSAYDYLINELVN